MNSSHNDKSNRNCSWYFSLVDEAVVNQVFKKKTMKNLSIELEGEIHNAKVSIIRYFSLVKKVKEGSFWKK
jgi:hypothetical protein